MTELTPEEGRVMGSWDSPNSHSLVLVSQSRLGSITGSLCSLRKEFRMIAQVFPYVVSCFIGILLGASWAESEIVRARVREAWSRGYGSGMGDAVSKAGADYAAGFRAGAGIEQFYGRGIVEMLDTEAVERLSRESGGRV